MTTQPPDHLVHKALTHKGRGGGVSKDNINKCPYPDIYIPLIDLKQDKSVNSIPPIINL